MPKKSESIWVSGLAVNLISNGVAAIVGGAVTYFSHEGATWVKPLLCGGAAWLITFCSILAFRYMRRVPKRPNPVTLENVEGRIRDWLDEFNLTVQRISDPESHFFFIVTTDGGKKIGILRAMRQFSDYILLRAIITTTDEEKRMIAEFSDEERNSLRLAIQLELGRAVMGYKTESIFEEMTIFKRIPITSTLTAEDFLNVMWEIEAMVGSIFLVGAMNINQHNLNKKRREVENEAGIQKREGGAKEIRGNNDQALPRPENGISPTEN